MRRVWAIARLTFNEGIRMRIVLVFLIVLIVLVLRMPFALRGDETLAGRLQNFLAYSLGALSLLLSLATIFFSCAALSDEFKHHSLHLIVTKPVSRFQILLGKWLGVNLLNILILVLCGGAIYGLAYFVKTRPVQFERDRLKVRDVVWTSRVASRPVVPHQQIEEAATQFVKDRIKTGEIEAFRQKQAIADKKKELLTQWRVIESGMVRGYEFENLTPPEHQDTAVQVRFKIIARPLPINELFAVDWIFCDPETGAWLDEPRRTRERSGEVHQFLVKAQPVIKEGRALLLVANPLNLERRTGLVFDGEDSLMILYKVDSFGLNFARALLVIFLRLVLLSAVGVFFSVFVSFPVACLCTCAFYVICLGMPFWMESLGADLELVDPKIDPYGTWGPAIRSVLVPLLRLAFPDFSQYDGTRLLVEGEYISYALVGRTLLHTLVYGGVLLLLPGWLIFSNREVAEVQV